MATPGTGKKAPSIEAPTLDGKKFSLDEARKQAPVLVAFFKVSCPTCQYAFPFLDRLHRVYPDGRVKVVGVSQDDVSATRDFQKEYGVSFPVALDDMKKYPASNAYGLTFVPSFFVVGPDGTVEQSSFGWVKEEFEQLNQRLAKAAGVPPAAIFKPGEQVADFKSG